MKHFDTAIRHSRKGNTMTKHIKILTVLLFVAGSALSATCGRADDLLAKGQKIYETNCLLCHGKNGKGDGPAAAMLNPKPADYTKPAFWSSDAAEKIAATIKNGKGQMPPFGLDDPSIQSVIYYLKHAFKPDKGNKS